MHVPQLVYDQRLAICRGCIRWLPSDRCSACGCFMSVKARAAHIKCPLGFWETWAPEA
ncbi:hypothetical protein SynSYN20_01656 [Synechococcus sp. SYN20]|nr:hypothetical protein SynSYN20_01656 [Synechococcus sp. SYN20]